MTTATKVKIVLAAIVIVLVAVIGLQNTSAVTAQLLFFSTSLPLTALLLTSFAAGLIAGLLLAFSLSRRHNTSKAA